MNRHKFKVGQTVMYLARERTSGTYKITQLMPSEGGDFQYRIRNTSEPHERVVKESDLDRAARPRRPPVDQAKEDTGGVRSRVNYRRFATVGERICTCPFAAFFHDLRN